MGTVNIDIKTQDAQTLAALKRLEREFKGLDTQIDRTSNRGVNLGKVMGGLAVGAGLKYAIGEFEEAEKSMRSTEAVIKSTGNAAEVSAEQQAKLVDELSRLAGIDDDVVNGGANMLRTFTEIKGENFGLALAASLDIAAMKGLDFASVAEQVGKALNDPVAGMGKLAKQGVVLSDVQKQQVRDFAAVGDKASAQKVILQELEVEYGGQAEAAATSSGKMKVAFGEAAESVGAILAPALQVAADAAGGLASVFGSMPAGSQAAVLGLGAVAVAAKKAESWVDGLDDGLGGLNKSLSAVDKGLIVATAGLAAFQATTAALDSVSDFKGNVEDLNAELNLLGEGKGTIGDLTSALGTDLDGLTTKFRQAADAPKDWKDGIGEIFSKGTEIIDTRQAQNTIEELDQALAGMVDSGNAAEAKRVFDELVETLADQGLAYDEIIPLLEDYDAAVDRAERSTADAAVSVEDASVATENWYGRTTDQTEALIEEKEALEESNDELQTNIDLIWGSVDANLALKGAHDSVQDAQVALAEARNNGSAEQQQRAEDDLTEAVMREVAAADELARKNAEASGEHYGAAESAAVQQAKLKELMAQTGLTSDEIIWFAAQLDNAAREREVKIYTAAAEERLKRLQALMIEIDTLSKTLTPLGSSALSGSAGAAIQQSEAYNNANGTTPPRRSLGSTGNVIVNGDLNVGGSKRDLDRAMDRASRNAGRGILVGS